MSDEGMSRRIGWLLVGIAVVGGAGLLWHVLHKNEGARFATIAENKDHGIPRPHVRGECQMSKSNGLP